MPQGKVGSGHQNRYKSKGVIILDTGGKVEFIKGRRTTRTRREEPPCWNGGTPVNLPPGTQPGDTVDGSKVGLNVDTIPDGQGGMLTILTTRKPGEPIEYNPMIQFHNEVMAGICADGMTRDLDNLDRPASAARLWRYLDTKYLKCDLARLASLLDAMHKEQDEEGLREIDSSGELGQE